jgi:ligand-binding sensor domain-containing protein
MIKYLTSSLYLLIIICTSCGQSQTKVAPDNTKSRKGPYTDAQLKEAATSKVPVSMVRNVNQARNGDVLIASYLGVFRYDGTSFSKITSTIPSPSFWDVLEDRKGNLWFASRDSGVYLLPSGQTNFQHFTTKDGLASNTALHIYEDKVGNIWFGSSRYDPSSSPGTGGIKFQNFTTKDGYPSNKIRLLLEDKTGRLWFGAQQEDLFVYNPNGKTFSVLKNKDGKAFNNVWSVLEDKKGNIWFGATIIEDKRGDTSFVSQGLWRYDDKEFTKVADRGAYDILQDKKGNIWTTGEFKLHGDWALSRYDAKSLYDKNPTATEVKLESGMLLGLLEDKKGNIWFGSGNGVYRYDGNTVTDFKN